MLFLSSSISQQHGQQMIDAPAAGSRQQRPKICNLIRSRALFLVFFLFFSDNLVRKQKPAKKQQWVLSTYLTQ
jgi:hypothetical protein